MNLRNLKRRLREDRLKRRNEVHLEPEVREIIKREIEGPLSLFLKTGQQYHNEIFFQSNVQWQISHLTNCATYFFCSGLFKVPIFSHCSQVIFTTFVVEHLNTLGTVQSVRVVTQCNLVRHDVLYRVKVLTTGASVRWQNIFLDFRKCSGF